MSDHTHNNSEIHIDDLTWREQDILNLLAERLSNREIAERLFLAESSVKDYVGKILRKLYVKNRRQAVEKAKELGILGEEKKIGSTRKTKLPSSATPFIGRTDELDEIRHQLGKTRLLTLTGPGGMGKTRLALRVAEDTVDDYQDGCFFVSLAPIRSVDHIIQAIAEAVNFPIPTHEDPKYQLLRYLRKKNLLLVMDNFEHLMDGVEIVSEIIENTPDVKVLATSRERLNLKSETVLNIAGMGEANNDAVALFLQSGTKALPSFEPSSEELTQIENVCQFMEGMPLAIELAASWLHVLSVSEINAELQKGLDILETEVRDAPERHRSIRAVFDQSWSLLEKSERGIFMRLSIFRGGFTHQAAEQVTGASLKQISGLVNKSILKHNPSSGRFEIHELLRQYAQERLEGTSQVNDATVKNYAVYYADFMNEKWGQLRGSEQISALTEIEEDIDNVRAAWRYFLDEQNAFQLKKFVYGFWLFYWVRGSVHGGVEIFREAVDAFADGNKSDEADTIRATAIANQSFFTSWMGLPDQGYALVKESIKILKPLNYSIGMAFALNSLTLAAYYSNRPVEEKEAARKFLRIAETEGDQWLIAYGYWLSSLAEFRNMNYSESKNLALESLKISEEIKDIIGISWCFNTLGQIAMIEKDLVSAEGYFKRCSQISKQLDFIWETGNAIKYLGQIALLTDNVDRAQEYFVRSLKISYDLGLERDIANHLYEFADLRAAQNRQEESVKLLSFLLQRPASHQARLGGGRIRDKAKTLLAQLESKLSQDVYEEALKRGELLDLDDVIIGLLGSKE